MTFSAFGSSSTYAVLRTAELQRIVALPRRTWTDEESNALAAQLTELLRTPNGSMALRPVQAIALAEIGMLGGMLGVLRVGAGKTLVSLLAPTVAEAERPLLVIPAKLQSKTLRDLRALSEHWQIPTPVIVTYEWLGRAQAADALDKFAPDCIICDEAHKLKNRSAAVTRRVRRYMKANPTTKFVAMSGTITKRSIHDYQHLLRWALPAVAVPLPDNYTDLETWADALDERKGMLRRASPGALIDLCDEEERRLWPTNPREIARHAYRRRLVDTSGVVATLETSVDATISMSCIAPPPSAAIDCVFDRLRKKWETPDGWPIADGLAMYRHAREIALGFYYVWDPRPPPAWLDARRDWCAFVRQTLSRSRSLDSELQVKRQFPDSRELQNWLRVKDSFEPRTRPIWIDDSVLKLCADWLTKDCGILWTEHKHFAEELARRTRVPYYGAGNAGDAEKHPKGASMILSIEAGREGLNLQSWANNFVVSPPPNGERWEQLIGRTHRDGQTADEVTFDVAGFSIDHVESFWQAQCDARYVAASLGSPQKLLVADHDFPATDDLSNRGGGRWNK